MPARCCVTDCKNVRVKGASSVKFFRFPNDQRQQSLERQAAWIKAIKRVDVTPLNAMHKTVCSEHFITGSPAHFMDKANPDWAPNIKLGHKKKTQSAITNNIHRVRKKLDPLAQEEIMEVDEFWEVSEDEEEKQTTSEQYQSEDITLSQYKLEIEKLKLDIDNLKKTVEEKDLIIKDGDAELNTITQTQQSEVEEKDLIIKRLKLLDKRKSLNMEAMKNNDKKVSYFTGLPSFEVLEKVFNFVKGDLKPAPMKGINIFDALILVLMKLRLDLPFTYMSYKFGTSTSTVSRIFYLNLKILSLKIGKLIRWPKKTVVEDSRVPGNRFTASIDCIENPGLAISREYSTNKTFKPTKHLIAISPVGAIIFVSKGFDSSLTVKEIVEICGLLDHAENGDILLSKQEKCCHKVVVDNETKMLESFENESNEVVDVPYVSINTHSKSSRENALESRTRSPIDVDTEKVISNILKIYSILSNKLKVTVGRAYKKDEAVAYFDDVVKVCCALVNASLALATTKKDIQN